MSLVRQSPCKINLILNILGKRPDGFHELETVMLPVPICDELEFVRAGAGVSLTCNHPDLPCDGRNLVHRAAVQFLARAGIQDGVSIHLEKRLPMAAGLGGGSGNAGTTLLALNDLFGGPLGSLELQQIAAGLGSDVPFFLQDQPALGEGRGEQVAKVPRLRALEGKWLVLVHPGFGISTPWAYQQLARFPRALHGEKGRARRLIDRLCGATLEQAAPEFYNSLEAPALEKYPILVLYQSFFVDSGAVVSLMSGSGSSTFAIFHEERLASQSIERFKERFGATCWVAAVRL